MPRNVERDVAKRLRDDPRWRVMVRSNNWVCPYCLKLGVRDLQLDEALEERIAGHLVSECQTWNEGAGVPGDVDRVRQAAQYIVFKVRVLGYMREDPRFRLRSADGRWLCPYCAEGAKFRPLQASLEPDFLEELSDDHELLSRVVDHLLRCDVFAQGEDKLRSRVELRRLTSGGDGGDKRHDPGKVAARFKNDPSYRLMDPDRRWLCPFCARVLDIKVPEGSGRTAFFEAVATHLNRCKAYTVLEGQPRPVAELRAKIEVDAADRQIEKLKRKIARHPLWRVRDLETNWLCPYCARITPARFPSKRSDGTFKEAPAQRFYASVLSHLSGCADYKSKNPIRSREDMAAAVQAENVQLDRHRRVRKWLLEIPVYGVTDAVSNWVCPHCRRTQKAITIGASVESATFEKTVEQVVAHLWSACEAFDEDKRPTVSPEELKQEVTEEALLKSGVHSNAAKVFKPQESLDEAGWQQLKAGLDAVQRRVDRAREQDRSLIEARQKQLRLLSEVPEVPGLEFARAYEPCDAVGGDFYSFFKPSAKHYSMVIGDITGHGIEAALLMGLAKKLVEVHGREQQNPRRVPSTQQTLCMANRDIFSDLDDRTFVTVFYGVLDVESRRFVFSRAGHNPVILYNTKREPPLQVLDSKGMALGMDEGPIFESSLEEVEVTLLPGDLVLQYTDGVTEAHNARNEQFGDDRLHDIVERFGRYEAEYLLWRILRAVEAFREGRRSSDDVTLVAFKVE